MPGRVPPQQLRLAPRERFPQAPPPQLLDQQVRGPYHPEPQQPLRQQPREPFPQEPVRQEPQEPFRQEPQEPFRQESQEPIRQESQEPFRQKPKEPFRQEPEEPVRQEPLEPFREEPQKQFVGDNAVAEEERSPVKRTPAAEEQGELAAESELQKRQDFAPPAEQRQAPSFGESEVSHDIVNCTVYMYISILGFITFFLRSGLKGIDCYRTICLPIVSKLVYLQSTWYRIESSLGEVPEPALSAIWPHETSRLPNNHSSPTVPTPPSQLSSLSVHDHHISRYPMFSKL